MVKAADVIWYGHILLKEEGNILKKALNFETNESRKKTKRVLEKKVDAMIKEMPLSQVEKHGS